jgi:hypothetical protein
MKTKSPSVEMITVYMQKNHPNRLDMRFKSNREYAKTLDKGKFWYFMQKLAELTGSPKVFGSSHLRWELWFNPIYRIKQKIMLRKPIQIYGEN